MNREVQINPIQKPPSHHRPFPHLPTKKRLEIGFKGFESNKNTCWNSQALLKLASQRIKKWIVKSFWSNSTYFQGIWWVGHSDWSPNNQQKLPVWSVFPTPKSWIPKKDPTLHGPTSAAQWNCLHRRNRWLRARVRTKSQKETIGPPNLSGLYNCQLFGKVFPLRKGLGKKLRLPCFGFFFRHAGSQMSGLDTRQDSSRTINFTLMSLEDPLKAPLFWKNEGFSLSPP